MARGQVVAYLDDDNNLSPQFVSEALKFFQDYRIFADYEYFVQCLSRWGTEKFLLNPLILVNYTQTSEGIIGRSHYHEKIVERNFFK